MSDLKRREVHADYVYRHAPHCPICSQAWPTAPYILVSEEFGLAMIGREHRRISRKPIRFLTVLARQYGRFINPDDLLWAAYSDQSDNDIPSLEAVGSGIMALRRVLEGTEYIIQSLPGRGYRLIKEKEAGRGLIGIERDRAAKLLGITVEQLQLGSAAKRLSTTRKTRGSVPVDAHLIPIGSVAALGDASGVAPRKKAKRRRRP